MSKKDEQDKIKQTLLVIYSKIMNVNTSHIAHDLMKKLVTEIESASPNSQSSKIIYILSQVSEHINSLKKGEKKESLKLLLSITSACKDISPYLSRILTILQSNISDENAVIFSVVSNIFGEIAGSSTRDNSDSNKTIYELLQGFCIYNMKQDTKANQTCGCLCLTSLIECNSMILQPAYMKYLWDNIVMLIDKPNFNATSEILNSLISLIFAAENLFKPFATVTLYKILDFLTDSDWFKRKLALNVIYTLIIYCQEDIVPLKGHIVEFLRVLKSDKIKEVRDVCMQTLKLFNQLENDSNSYSDIEGTDSKNIKINKLIDKSIDRSIDKISTPRKMKINLSSNNTPRNRENKKSITVKRKTINNDNSRIHTEIHDDFNISEISGINTGINNKIDNETPHKNLANHTNKITSNSSKNIINRVKTKDKLGKVDRSTTPIKKSPIENINNSPHVPHSLYIPHLNSSNNFASNLTNTTNKEDYSTINRSVSLSRRDVNRKDDNTFVNSKIVIKRDPSYSIFKTSKNEDFFSTKKEDIEIIVREKKIPDHSDHTDSNKNNKVIQMITENEESKSEVNEKIDNQAKYVDLNEIHQINPITNNKNEISVSNLLREMKSLSDKQVYLIDSLEKIYKNTEGQFQSMNDRIIKLEDTVNILMNYIKSSESNSNRNKILNSSPVKNSPVKNEIDKNVWGQILLELKKKNATSAINIALNSEEINLIKLLEKIHFSQLKDVDSSTMEEVIPILVNQITKGKYITIIISFFCKLLINVEYNLKSGTLQNIKNVLLFASSNKFQFGLSNQDMVDINILLTHINNKIGGISSMINSFASSTSNNN